MEGISLWLYSSVWKIPHGRYPSAISNEKELLAKDYSDNLCLAHVHGRKFLGQVRDEVRVLCTRAIAKAATSIDSTFTNSF